jgi:hemoglobin
VAPASFYDRVGGAAFFEQLTRRFYHGIGDDPVLGPLYPDGEADLEQARVNLRDFLVQFWGGPDHYRQRRGEPRLRQRHAPFPIGPAERDAWVARMSAALSQAGLGELEEIQLRTYLSRAAAAMVNTPDG